MKHILLLSLVVLLSACASQINHLHNASGQPPLILNKIPLNTQLLPDFDQQFQARPTAPGKIYHLAIREKNRITRSFEIAVLKGPRSTAHKPLKVVYEWTGKGFVAGLDAATGSNMVTDLLMIAVLPAAGAVAGFVVGLFASIPESYKQLERALTTSRERLLSQSDYRYDQLSRLTLIDQHLPGTHGRKLIRTEFHYQGTERSPYQVTIYSHPEDKQRILYRNNGVSLP